LESSPISHFQIHQTEKLNYNGGVKTILFLFLIEIILGFFFSLSLSLSLDFKRFCATYLPVSSHWLFAGFGCQL
jgi:hypothetical protein